MDHIAVDRLVAVSPVVPSVPERVPVVGNDHDGARHDHRVLIAGALTVALVAHTVVDSAAITVAAVGLGAALGFDLLAASRTHDVAFEGKLLVVNALLVVILVLQAVTG